MTEINKHQTKDTEEPVCPYCYCDGRAEGLGEGEIIECEWCGKQYAVDATELILYTTRKVDDDAK